MIVSRFAPVAVVAAFSLFAGEAYANDLGEIQLGQSYQVSSMQELTGYFVAPATGTLKVSGPGAMDVRFYSDEAHTDLIKNNWNGQYGGGWVDSYDVVSGTTYYIYNKFAMNGGEVKFDMEGLSVQDLNYNWINPDPVKEPLYDLGHNSNIEIKLTQEGASVESATFMYVNKDGQEITAPWTNVRVSGSSVLINGVATRLTSLLNSGDILPGNTFSFTVKGIESKEGALLIVGGEPTGELTLQYTVSGIPVNVIAQSWPEKFLSYWPKGSEAGIASISFSDQINSEQLPYCYISCGNNEGDLGIDYYREQIPVSVDGNTVYMDFTGVRRTIDDLFVAPPSNDDKGRFSFDHFTITISGIRDLSGALVQTPGQGTVGSVTAYLPYEEIKKGAVSMEATPANGSDLENGNVEIWYAGIQNFRFSGFNATYEANGETVTVKIDQADVTEKISTNGQEGTYTFTLPEAAWKGHNLVITPAEYFTLDGYDYNSILAVHYNGFAILGLDPAADSNLAVLEEGKTIMADFNYAEKYPELYVMYKITDLNAENPDDAVLKYTWMTRQPDGLYTSENHNQIRLYKNHTYELLFEAWESETAKNNGDATIGTATAQWFGLTVPYTFSDITFESITPAEGTVLTAADREFTLTFSGSVHLTDETTYIIQGQGIHMPFEAIEAIGDYVMDTPETGIMSPEWKLTVPAAYMEELGADLVFSVVATDDKDIRVEGNAGKEENTFLSFTYEVANSYKAVSVEPGDGAVIGSIESFYVSSDLGLGYNWNNGSIKVLDENGNTVASVKEVKDAETAPNDEYTVVKIEVVLDKKIEEDGVYTCVLEKGAFNVGSGFDTWMSAAATLTWTVKSNSVEAEIADAETLYTVFNLQGVCVLNNADADALKALAPGIYIVNGKKYMVK